MISFDTAKRLWIAHFPKIDHSCAYGSNKILYHLDTSPIEIQMIWQDLYPCYSIEELLAQLPKTLWKNDLPCFSLNVYWEPMDYWDKGKSGKGQWVIEYLSGLYSYDGLLVKNESLTEACAEIYCKLKEEGII